MLRGLEKRDERVRNRAAKLEALSPLAVLARGYAVAYKQGTRRPLFSSTEARVGDRIRVRLHDGELGAVVREGGRVPDNGPLFREEPPAAAGPAPGLFPDEERE